MDSFFDSIRIVDGKRTSSATQLGVVRLVWYPPRPDGDPTILVYLQSPDRPDLYPRADHVIRTCENDYSVRFEGYHDSPPHGGIALRITAINGQPPHTPARRNPLGQADTPQAARDRAL